MLARDRDRSPDRHPLSTISKFPPAGVIVGPMTPRSIPILLAAASLAVACASQERDPVAHPTLAAATQLGVRNARMPIEGLVTAGQPTVEQVEGLVDAGYTSFISLRPETEDGAGWEESHAAGRAYGFARLPISGAGDLTRENVEAFAGLLADVGDEPTVLYCGSSNRVGAMLALKAYWLDGAEAEEALALGLAGGMTRLEGPVREILGVEPDG